MPIKVMKEGFLTFNEKTGRFVAHRFRFAEGTFQDAQRLAQRLMEDRILRAAELIKEERTSPEATQTNSLREQMAREGHDY